MDIYPLLEKLNIKNPEIFPILHEEAMVAKVYKIQSQGLKPAILKVCSHANLKREQFFLNHFEGVIPVPKVLSNLNDGKNEGILLEFLQGHLLQQEEISPALAFELGSILAKIHQSRTSGYGDLIQKELYQDPWSYYAFKFDEGLEECQGHLSSNLIEKSKRFFESQYLCLQSADGPCIVHRDFRPGNIIVDQGKVQGVIDWAGARASFAEEDLSSLEHGEWKFNSAMKKIFLEGYESIRPLPDYVPMIPFLRINKAIATIGFTVKRNTWNTLHSKIYQSNRQFLDKILG